MLRVLATILATIYKGVFMPAKAQITSIVPKKYRVAAEIFDYADLQDFEGKLRRMNEQTAAAWFVEALAIYTILWDGDLYKTSGLTWKQYKADTGKRLGLLKRDFSDYFLAGKFLAEHGKQLFLSGFDPIRSSRKLARADLALRLCGDVDQVIDHLVNDQWEEFHAWYSGMKELALPGPVKKAKKREIAVIDGRVFINGKEPVRISRSVTEKERKDLERLVANYFKVKAGK